MVKIYIQKVYLLQYGTASSTDFAKKLGAIVEDNIIRVNEQMETNVEGLYACGDCTGGLLQADGAISS